MNNRASLLVALFNFVVMLALVILIFEVKDVFTQVIAAWLAVANVGIGLVNFNSFNRKCKK